ncbi:MAG: VacJ family lipoprotein [Candidatus Competibacterales bacterium]|nr:VacJ family lipoprotein [Candidatus Competibacterales bacterium]
MPKSLSFPIRRLGLALALCLAAPAGAQDAYDPFEGFNRLMFGFNQRVDRYLLEPTARGYRAITPEPVDTGISNFFSNLGDVSVLVNDLLQFKFHQAAQDSSRLVFNTTFGLGGLIDVATPMGLPKHDEDFGQTLGYWGLGSGPYLILPLLGSSSGRDVWRWPVDSYLLDPLTAVDSGTVRASATTLDLIDTRADLLEAGSILEEAALDPYTFQREAYLQRRLSLVHDGNPPRPDFDFDFDDEAEDEPPSAAP